MSFELTYSNGIHMPHLSASTINAFITSRFDFYERKVRKAPFTPNFWMARGTAVEHAINEILDENIEPEEASDCAMEKYLQELEGWLKLPDDKKDTKKEEEVRAAIPGLVECAYQHFDATGLFDPFHKAETQKKLTMNLNGVEREILMFLDFFVDGLQVRDCKVSNKKPSKLSQGYIIQGSLYRKATGLPVVFDFIVSNKTPIAHQIALTDEDYSFGLNYARVAAQLLEELEECKDPKRVMEIMSFPDLSAMWSDSDKQAAKVRWGI